MIRTLDLVALLENLPESKLRRGDVGIVVTWHITAAQYDVEFSATTERAVTLVTLREDQLSKLNQAPAELSPMPLWQNTGRRPWRYPLLRVSLPWKKRRRPRSCAYRPISVCMICCISCVFIARQTLLPTGFGSGKRLTVLAVASTT